MRPYLFLLSLFAFLSCKDKPVAQKESEVFDESTDSVAEKENSVNEKDFIPLDISDYLSSYLLIGQSQAFKANQIENLDIGYNGSFCASDFGDIVPPISVETVPV